MCGDEFMLCKDFLYYSKTLKSKNEDRNPSRDLYYKLFPNDKEKIMPDQKPIIGNLPDQDIIKLQTSVEKKCWQELDRFFSSNSLGSLEKSKLACATLGVLMNEKKLQTFLTMKRLK